MAFRRHVVFIGSIAVVGSVLGFLLAGREPAQYEAVSIVQFVAPQSTGPGPGTAFQVRQLVENTALAGEIVRKHKLDQPPFALTAQTFLREALIIQEIPGTIMLRLGIRLTDPDMALAVTNTLVEKALERMTAAQHNDRAKNLQRVQAQVDEASGRLRHAERAILEYRQQTQLERRKADVEAFLSERQDLLRASRDLERERVLHRASPTQERELNDIYAKEMELSRLEGERDVKKRVYTDLAVRLEGLRAEDQIVEPAGVVTAAIRPDQPLPRRSRDATVVGLLAGAMMAAGVVFLRESRLLRAHQG